MKTLGDRAGKDQPGDSAFIPQGCSLTTQQKGFPRTIKVTWGGTAKRPPFWTNVHGSHQEKGDQPAGEAVMVMVTLLASTWMQGNVQCSGHIPGLSFACTPHFLLSPQPIHFQDSPHHRCVLAAEVGSLFKGALPRSPVPNTGVGI